MTRKSAQLVLAIACVLVVVRQGRTDTPPETVKAAFKVYDKDGNVLAQANRTIPKHTNAFDAFRRTFTVDFDTYPTLGNFVTVISGVSQVPADNLYWMLYVDGRPSQLGISNFYIDKDTLIEFKLETPKEPVVAAGQKLTVRSHVHDKDGKQIQEHKVEITVKSGLPLPKQDVEPKR